jgi:hypothetical protein
MTPEERLAYLLEVVAIPSNRGRLTHSWVAENVSLAAADAVYAAINSVSQPTALRYNVGNGIDTSAELWKAQAEAVAESDESLAPHLESLRDFELIRMPRWQSEGYESEPTLALVEKELIVSSTRSKLTNIAAFLDTVDLSGYTATTLQTAIDSRMASEDGI